MIHSVWNQGQKQYDYYKSPALQKTANTPKPAHLRHRKLGSTVMQAGWPLPKDAKKIGSGDYPHGRISSLGADEPPSWLGYIVIFAAVWYLWKKL